MNGVNEKLLINNYYEEILNNKIKILFNQPYRGSKTKKDFKNNIYDIQLWKTDHPASIYAFYWLTHMVDVCLLCNITNNLSINNKLFIHIYIYIYILYSNSSCNDMIII